MLGRTHFFIGTAAALAVLQPQTVPALVAGAGAAAIGGLISDIDVGTSQAHRDADKIITATVAVAVLTILNLVQVLTAYRLCGISQSL